MFLFGYCSDFYNNIISEYEASQIGLHFDNICA